MPNQHKPLRAFLSYLELFSSITQVIAPLDLVETHIRRYHAQGVSFDKMVPLLSKHYDTDSYGLGCVSFSFSARTFLLHGCFRKTRLKSYAKTLGLTSARSQGHTFDTISGPIAELRKMYPNAGANLLRVHLRNEFDMRVSR